jgi:8-oxo-dGTP pyrophosphatase MutT (NUDIX family)
MTARREAFEEIGLPMEDDKLPSGYSVEHLTELPTHLAMTELGVRPCVAYLKAPEPSIRNRNPDVARDILPKLDAREVAAVFTAPFQNFLLDQDIDPAIRRKVPGEWYKGSWHAWQETAWRMHQFHVPVTSSTVYLARTPIPYLDPRGKLATPSTLGSQSSEPSDAASSQQGSLSSQPTPAFPADTPDALRQARYRVWGMTARILVDCARVAYGGEPQFEHTNHFGDGMSIFRMLIICQREYCANYSILQRT